MSAPHTRQGAIYEGRFNVKERRPLEEETTAVLAPDPRAHGVAARPDHGGGPPAGPPRDQTHAYRRAFPARDTQAGGDERALESETSG